MTRTARTTPAARYTCEDVFRRLDDYVDRELGTAEMQRVREHLAVCAACAREHAFEAALLATVRDRLRRIDVPASLRARVTRLLAAEDAPPTAP